MYLNIAFNNKVLPFTLDVATEERCLEIIEKAKRYFNFNKSDCVIDKDRITLNAYNKKPKTTLRLYCFNDKIILQTDTKYPDEVNSTKELLAYERNIDIDNICVVEI